MSNIFGMSQINGHLQNVTLASQVPQMTIAFANGPPTMVQHIPTHIQVPLPPPSTSNAASTTATTTSTANRQNSSGSNNGSTASSTPRSRNRNSSDNMVKCNFCPKKYLANQVWYQNTELPSNFYFNFIFRSIHIEMSVEWFDAMNVHNVVNASRLVGVFNNILEFICKKGHMVANFVLSDSHKNLIWISMKEFIQVCLKFLKLLLLKRKHSFFAPKRFSYQDSVLTFDFLGAKPFVCQFCGRGFRQRSQQIGHEATHPAGAIAAATSNSLNSTNSSGIFSVNTTGSDQSSISDNVSL